MIRNLHYDFFISYSHKDSNFIDNLYELLKSNKYRCFLDKISIDWGDTIGDEIKLAINNCECLIVILSNNSINSTWVPYEIGQARALNNKILPIVIDNVKVPDYIKKLNYIKSIDEIEDALSRLNTKTKFGQLLNPKNFLLTAYLALLVTGVAGGEKIIQVGNFQAAATVISFAFTYLITDIVHQVYGKSEARKFVIPGIIAMLISVVFFYIFVNAPAHTLFEKKEEYDMILSVPPRMFISGIIAFRISQFIDINIFQRLISLINENFMWLRSLLSTLLSQMFDTIIFIFLAFYILADTQHKNIQDLIIGQYMLKIIIAVLAVPLFIGAIKSLTTTRRLSF